MYLIIKKPVLLNSISSSSSINFMFTGKETITDTYLNFSQNQKLFRNDKWPQLG